MLTFPVLLAGATGLIASVLDLRSRRVPNYLTFGSAVAAAFFLLATDGLGGLGWSAGGWVVGCALFLPFFALRGLGAGDVKLLAALGAWLGPITVFWVAVYAAIAGGVLAITVALARGYLRRAVSNVGYVIWYWSLLGLGPVPDFTLTDAKGPRLPYALPITVGLAAALWIG